MNPDSMSSAGARHHCRLVMPHQGLHTETITLDFTYFLLYILFFCPARPIFKLVPLFTDERRTAPVQDTAQRRHRRRRAVGTRSKDSFQIKTLRKPFLLSLVATRPLVL